MEPDVVVSPLDELLTQENAEYNLAIISSQTGFSSREPLNPYTYDSIAGEGQSVYVVDTGVFVEHEEFEGVSFFFRPSPMIYSRREECLLTLVFFFFLFCSARSRVTTPAPSSPSRMSSATARTAPVPSAPRPTESPRRPTSSMSRS